MTVDGILEEAVASQGWNESTQLEIILEYVENQKDPAAFEDFLQQYIFEEDEDD